MALADQKIYAAMMPIFFKFNAGIQASSPEELKEKLAQVTKLDLSGKNIRDEDLTYLKEVPNIEELDLSQNLISADGIQHLDALKKLTKLSLRANRGDEYNRYGITDEAVSKLVNLGLENLTYLDLSHTRITDQSLKTLAEGGLPNLCKLDIQDNLGISDKGLNHLTRLNAAFEENKRRIEEERAQEEFKRNNPYGAIAGVEETPGTRIGYDTITASIPATARKR